MTDAAMSLDGTRVIVIGGASGIGFAVAALARELGAEVVIASSQTANVDAAVARLPGATGRTVDLRDGNQHLALLRWPRHFRSSRHYRGRLGRHDVCRYA